MSDLFIDCCDDIDEIFYGDQLTESTAPITIWNGREVTPLSSQETIQKAIETIHSDQVQDAPPLTERLIEQIYLDEQTLEEILEENGYRFDTAPLHLIDCKSYKDHLKQIEKELLKANKKASRALRKAAKKAAELLKKAMEAILHGTKKAAHNVEKFVREHKKETFIAVAIIAAIVGAIIVSSALQGAAAASG